MRMNHQRISPQALYAYWQVPEYKIGPGRPRSVRNNFILLLIQWGSQKHFCRVPEKKNSRKLQWVKIESVFSVEENGPKFFQETQRNFFPSTMLGAFCTRLAPIFDIPEVELESVFNAVGRIVSGNAHSRCANFYFLVCAIFANVECRMSTSRTSGVASFQSINQTIRLALVAEKVTYCMFR